MAHAGTLVIKDKDTPIARMDFIRDELIPNKDFRHAMMFGNLTIEGDEDGITRFSEVVSLLIARGILKYKGATGEKPTQL